MRALIFYFICFYSFFILFVYFYKGSNPSIEFFNFLWFSPLIFYFFFILLDVLNEEILISIFLSLLFFFLYISLRLVLNFGFFAKRSFVYFFFNFLLNSLNGLNVKISKQMFLFFCIFFVLSVHFYNFITDFYDKLVVYFFSFFFSNSSLFLVFFFSQFFLLLDSLFSISLSFLQHYLASKNLC